MMNDPDQVPAAPVQGEVLRGAPRWPVPDFEPVNANNENAGFITEQLALLSRGKYWLAAMTALGVLVAFAYVVRQPDIYQASATIEMQALNDSFLNMNQADVASASENLSPSQPNLQTQIHILMSSGLRERTAQKLRQKPAGPVTPTAGYRGLLRRKLGLDITDPEAYKEFSIAIAQSTATANIVRGTRIIQISCRSTSPDAASAYVNQLASEYIDYSLDARFKNTQRTSGWLQARLEETRRKLSESEARLDLLSRSPAYQRATGSQGLNEARIKQLQMDLSSIQADRIAKQTKYEAARSSPPEALTQLSEDATLRDLESKITDLKRQYAELMTVYTPAHAKVQRVVAQQAEYEDALNQQRQRVMNRLRADYEAAMNRERLLSNAYNASTLAPAASATSATQFAVLKQEVENTRQLYNVLLQQTSQTGLAAIMPLGNMRIIDPAAPPGKPAAPKTAFLLILGAVGGLGLSVAGLVFFHNIDGSIRKPGHTMELLGVPEIGVIPTVNGVGGGVVTRVLGQGRSAGLLNLGPDTDDTVELVMWNDKPSLAADAFRGTLTSLMFPDKNGVLPRVIVVTSAAPNEGKTTVACNLAIGFTEANRRVVLVDADMRRPRLHNVFDIPNTSGLSNIILGQPAIDSYPIESLAHSTHIPGLFVLPSGPAVLHVSNVLFSRWLIQLVARLRKSFDIVILDTPPMLHYSDARVLGRLSDGVIMVIRSGQTDRSSALLAQRRLWDDGTAILGTVLNDWDPRKGGGVPSYSSSYYRPA